MERKSDDSVHPAGFRSQWTCLTDPQLLAQCEVDTYRASGPGGQKRNKTSSAVRLRHEPSGLIVIAEESRSQHENKAKALKRMRRAFYLEIRESLPIEFLERGGCRRQSVWSDAAGELMKVKMGVKHPQFWDAMGLLLDLLVAHAGRVSDVAASLEISTGNLIELLEVDEKVWQRANNWRAKLGQKPLRASE